MTIVVLNAGTGNVRSVVRALEHVGAEVNLTTDPEAILNADGLLVPGVGAFESVMQKLRSLRADRLIERRLSGGQPVLGICVGMQVMFDQGTEHGTHQGLGQWPGSVDKLQAPVVPHMGWSRVDAAPGTQLLAGLDGERFYFVHSYAVQTDPTVAMDINQDLFEPPLVSYATYYQPFVAAVENGPLTATQFHPEKSGEAGFQVLANWLDMIA
ncbi:MAG: imidazole glycerol phosphate synthase subunit HisH [Actinomycetaceae bacterium]|nr:imidazole glycerol phosphate synthase subunit HisH [Actinomycetaceae bacterium]